LGGDDVAVAAGVEFGVVGLAVAASSGGDVVDLLFAATAGEGVVRLSVATLSQRASSRNQAAVSTTGLLVCVVPNARVLSSLTAVLVSTIDEMARTTCLRVEVVDGGAAATL
jgi:hypothetical protein